MKLDPAFTQQVQDYLAQPIEQRDLQRGAELMLQMNRNRSLHRYILRRGDSVRLERELIKYLRIRLDGLTRREVYFLEKETLPRVRATFRAAAQAAAILGCDDDLARIWADTAEQLRRWLPKNPEGTAYIPYPGCPDQSIALLSGLYPYPCLPPDDPCQRAGIEAFVATESQFGNMYPVGKSLCTWYAGWKALAFCRLGERDIAKTVIAQMCDDTGCFSEVFEICEGGYHPWFTTGEGTLLQAICEAYASD